MPTASPSRCHMDEMNPMPEQPTSQAEPLRRPEVDPLAQTWATRIESARKHWGKFHKRVKHNRKVVAGINKEADPTSADYIKHRANLIQGTITAVLPSIYARNPEMSCEPVYQAENLKLLCQTVEKVTNRQLEAASLKARAKATVRAALTCSFGVVKVTYQRDLRTDPVIQSRINDTQDNIAHVEQLLAKLDDPEQAQQHESTLAELRENMRALNEQLEVVAAEGLTIDRVLTEHLLIDPSVIEFWDYATAGWMMQTIPMRRGDAEGRYKVKLDQATTYTDKVSGGDGRFASGSADKAGDDDMIAVLEIWDRTSQTIYTMAEGCKFWLRDPYSPQAVGRRWYPYFLLPFQTVDGEFVAPSLVDLTEKLQEEHNQARDRFNKHRDLAIPGWVASGETSEASLKRFAKSTSVEGFGEITIIDTEGKPLSQVIVPRQHPAVDPAIYDTGAVRQDWEMVTGMQDAARSSIVKPKTATEANIMQQSLSGRVSEFRDQVEDFLQEISQYSAEVLLQELTVAQVERIVGPPQEVEVISTPGGDMEQPVRHYDWPELSRDDVFELIQMRIRAGTTGQPDRLEQQESWTKVMPVIDGLLTKIMQAAATGQDPEPFKALLRETVKRFDEKLDVEQFMPKPPPAPAAPAAPASPSIPGLPGALGGAMGGIAPQALPA